MKIEYCEAESSCVCVCVNMTILNTALKKGCNHYKMENYNFVKLHCFFFDKHKTQYKFTEILNIFENTASIHT